jgi:hypothetical protein
LEVAFCNLVLLEATRLLKAMGLLEVAFCDLPVLETTRLLEAVLPL